MHKVLRNRVFRDLKENLFRYLALGTLIIMCMYLIVALIGAADTIIIGGNKRAEEQKVEDGEFTVFAALTDKEISNLTEKGITIEKQFYLDYKLDDNSTLRAFRNRENINLLNVEQGELAKNDNEVVLEKRYSEEHEISVGDEIEIGGNKFKISGIATTPDYDGPYKEISDSTVDSKQFGVAFFTSAEYEKLKSEGNSSKTEEYTYAYLLNDSISNDDLKKEIKEIKVDINEIDDEYFKEYWNENVGKRDDLKDGVNKLADGSKELSDGLISLSDYKDELNKGATEIFNAYLKEASQGLMASGLQIELTEGNFKKQLLDLQNATDNEAVKLQLSAISKQLSAIYDYKNGVEKYTEGVTVAADGSSELTDGIKELKENTDKLLDEYFNVELDNLTSFLTAEDNPRIGAAANDQVINRIGGLVAGAIIIVLFAYVISVFVVHSIEKESSVIGSLYALGVKKRDLMGNYIALPVIVTATSSIIGTIIGFSPLGINWQMQDCYDYFSIPKLDTVYTAYLLVYALVMPILLTIIVNWLVIRKKLSKPALSLIRNEVKESKISNVDLGNMGFISRFRIRQMLREIRTSFTVIFGMFICLLIAILGIDCYVMCTNISIENKADTKYEYMYTYKYPEKNVPEGGTICFAKGLKSERFGYNLDVTLLGIDNDNPYFDANVKEGKNKIIIASATAQKYNLKVGDKVILTDEEEDRDYAFTVDGITQYSTGLYAFMDIKSMRELFGQEDDYYNVVFSDNKLDVPSGRLYSVTSKSEVEEASDVFTNMMMPMIYMMTIISALIFCVVMYLMIKVMIDRSAFGISLIKIFGYRMSEIKKLYLNGNFYTVAIGAAICIPLSKVAMDALYPIMVANVASGMNLHFSWEIYVGMYLAIILLYFVISYFLVRRLKAVKATEVLKNRE